MATPYLSQYVEKLLRFTLGLRQVIIIIMLSAYVALFHVFMLKALYIITLALWVGAAI